ncbi:hypothetical protein O5541_03520 [Escherichia coli]|nr:hypothetical protein [Escherichia coli]
MSNPASTFMVTIITVKPSYSRVTHRRDGVALANAITSRDQSDPTIC